MLQSELSRLQFVWSIYQHIYFESDLDKVFQQGAHHIFCRCLFAHTHTQVLVSESAVALVGDAEGVGVRMKVNRQLGRQVDDERWRLHEGKVDDVEGEMRKKSCARGYEDREEKRDEI